ncbi:MAG: hypothetical protein LW832_09130 [Parachlamydia sp.]|jgi:hypothetical protein|nr:hypothetical protein [Parachlamydia sp.]
MTSDGSIPPLSYLLHTSPPEAIYDGASSIINATCNSHPSLQHFCQSIEASLPDFLKNNRPNALFLTAKDDPNGALNFGYLDVIAFKRIESQYNVTYKKVSDVASFCLAIDKEKAKGNNIDLLIVKAHGSQESIALDQNNEFSIYSPLPQNSCLQNLSSKVTILLDSCSAGKGRESEKNFANYIALNAPRSARIFAATVSQNNFVLSQENPIEFKFRVLGFFQRDLTPGNITYEINAFNREEAINNFLRITNIGQNNTWKGINQEFLTANLSDSHLGLIPLKTEPTENSTQPQQYTIFSETVLDEIDTIVDRVIGYLGDKAFDATGVPAALNEFHDLENIISTIFESPLHAPLRIGEKLISSPSALLKAVLASPKQSFLNLNSLLGSPEFETTFAFLTSAYSVIALASSLIPLCQLTKKALKKPLKAPIILSKELIKAPYNNVLGVCHLAEGLVNRPFKTIECLGKGLLLSPMALFTSVKGLFGKSKRKKIKSKIKKLERLQAAEQRARERELREVNRLLPLCYEMAKQQWVIATNDPQEYVHSLVNDWDHALCSGQFVGPCSQFLQTIEIELKYCNFAEVVRLSPSVHRLTPVLPEYLVNGIVKYAQSNLKLAYEIDALESQTPGLQNVTNDLSGLTSELKEEVQLLEQAVQARVEPALSETSAKLETHIQTLTVQNEELRQNAHLITARLRNRMSPEKAASLMAKLAGSNRAFQ